MSSKLNGNERNGKMRTIMYCPGGSKRHLNRILDTGKMTARNALGICFDSEKGYSTDLKSC